MTDEVNEKEANEKEVNEKEGNEKETDEKEVNEKETNGKGANENMTNENRTNENKANENVSSNDQDDLLKLAVKLLEQEASPEMFELRKMLIRRIIMESDIKPSRIPAPVNITEIGGYINLMRQLNQEEMLRQTIASILGLPMRPPLE
ncbi:MAG: hypothetical protein LBE57_01190 [Methanosarcinales archaeon]|jgi:hypothetical protein|nr:hypothetical protein [Methanosarcinales archaeon]